jgi:hypothetical protein
MRKLVSALSLLFALFCAGAFGHVRATDRAVQNRAERAPLREHATNARDAPQDPAAGQSQTTNTQERRVMSVPGKRHRRVRADRPRGRGIRTSFKKAGRSAGRGGKRFGKNVGHGRPVRGGKEFGKGMGGFGKHTGKGVARTAKRVAKP